MGERNWWRVDIFPSVEGIVVCRSEFKPSCVVHGRTPIVVEDPVQHITYEPGSTHPYRAAYVYAKDQPSAMQSAQRLYDHYRARWSERHAGAKNE
jgi:hypothetical protein